MFRAHVEVTTLSLRSMLNAFGRAETRGSAVPNGPRPLTAVDRSAVAVASAQAAASKVAECGEAAVAVLRSP